MLQNNPSWFSWKIKVLVGILYIFLLKTTAFQPLWDKEEADLFIVTFHWNPQILNLIRLQVKVTHFFLSVFSPLCVLFSPLSPVFSLHLSMFLSCFCVAAALDACLHFLLTSDLQMSYMLRSSSTRPLARSWTMHSMTWPLCRCPVARLSVLLVSDLVFSSFPSSHAASKSLKMFLCY